MLLHDSFLVFLPSHCSFLKCCSIEQRNHLCHCLNLLYQLWGTVYARVLTDRQTVDMQIHELKEYIKHRGFIDQGYLGSDTKKPAFREMINGVKKRKFDVLLVWKLDHLGRSMKDLVMALNGLQGSRIDFVSYDNRLAIHPTDRKAGVSCDRGRGAYNLCRRMAWFVKMMPLPTLHPVL